MSDEDFIKMLAAANNITLTKNEQGELNVAGDDTGNGTNLITPEQTNQTYLGSYATRHLTAKGNVRGVIHDTMDAAGAVVKSPWTLTDKAVSTVEDIANAGLKWFDDDAEDISLDFLKSGVKPARTPLGRFVGVAAEVAAATALTTPAGGAAILTHGAAKAGISGAAQTAGALLKAGPKTATALQTTANALRNAAVDFIVSNPDDKNIAAELQEVINKPWLAALATQPADSRIVRRYKHMVDGFAIGELAFPAIGKLAELGGKAASRITDSFPTPKPATIHVPPETAKAMDDFAASIPSPVESVIEQPIKNISTFDAAGSIKGKLTEQGIEPTTATHFVNLIEGWAVNAKRNDETLEDFFAARNIIFENNNPHPNVAFVELGTKEISYVKTRSSAPKKGFIDLPAIGTPFSKENPATIKIGLSEGGDESTLIHELGHLTLHDKLDCEVKGLLSPDEVKELAAIKKLIGWKKGQKTISTAQQETYAKAFEQWFQTGTAPRGMEESFQGFKKQMTDIYEDSLATGADLPEGYNALFGKMLGKADTTPERLRLYQIGANPEKEAEAIISAGKAKGQAEYGYTVNPLRLTGKDRQLHMEQVTEELSKLSPVPDDITRIHHVKDLDRQAREMIYKVTGSGSDGQEMRKQILEMMNLSKTWNARIRYCEYMMQQGAEQLAPLYQQLDDVTDDAAKTIVKGKIFAQLQTQAFYRNANAQLTATAGRILEGKKHGITPLDFDTLMKSESNEIFKATNPMLREIPKEALDRGDVQAVKKAFDEIGEDKVDALIHCGKLHMDDLQNASIAFDYQSWDLKTKLWKNAQERYIHNLLSNPATWLINTASNAVQAAVSPLAWMIDGAARYGIGKAASFIGIEDFAKRVNLSSTDGAETFRMGLNLYNSYRIFVADAFSIAKRAYKSGKPIVSGGTAFVDEYTPARMLSSEVWDMNPVSNAGRIVDGLGQILNIPGRILMSTDQFFKVLAGRGGTYAEIMEDALAKGITRTQIPDYIEEEMSKRVIQKISNGHVSSEIYSSEAVRDFVKEQTFTQDAGAITQAMVKVRESCPYLFPLMPFIQSPVNIVKVAASYTQPIAGLRVLGAGIVNLNNLMRKNQAVISKGGLARSKLLGQFAIAQGIWSAACFLVQDGKITGGLSKNPSVRKTQSDLGLQPYSLRIGDTWYSYSALDPFGTVLGIAADYHTITQEVDDSEEWAQRICDIGGAMTAALGNNLGNKTYLMTLGNTLNALLNDPENSGKYWGSIAANTATGFIMPRVVTNAARDLGISDPYMKEIRGCLDKMQSNIPGLSDSLPTQYSWLTGKPREYSPYSSINRFYAKSAESDVPDKLSEELKQLDQVLAGPSDRMNGRKLTGEQYSRYCQLNASATIADKTLIQALDEAVYSQRYTDGDSDERAKILRSTIGHYRNAAKIQLIEEYPELESEEKKQRMTSGLPQATGTVKVSSDIDKLIEYGKS